LQLVPTPQPVPNNNAFLSYPHPCVRRPRQRTELLQQQRHLQVHVGLPRTGVLLQAWLLPRADKLPVLHPVGLRCVQSRRNTRHWRAGGTRALLLNSGFGVL
ncbi:hypothetical protein C8R43DRAFT_1235557, partial [Mycena crocata]